MASAPTIPFVYFFSGLQPVKERPTVSTSQSLQAVPPKGCEAAPTANRRRRLLGRPPLKGEVSPAGDGGVPPAGAVPPAPLRSPRPGEFRSLRGAPRALPWTRKPLKRLDLNFSALRAFGGALGGPGQAPPHSWGTAASPAGEFRSLRGATRALPWTCKPLKRLDPNFSALRAFTVHWVVLGGPPHGWATTTSSCTKR